MPGRPPRNLPVALVPAAVSPYRRRRKRRPDAERGRSSGAGVSRSCLTSEPRVHWQDRQDEERQQLEGVDGAPDNVVSGPPHSLTLVSAV